MHRGLCLGVIGHFCTYSSVLFLYFEGMHRGLTVSLSLVTFALISLAYFSILSACTAVSVSLWSSDVITGTALGGDGAYMLSCSCRSIMCSWNIDMWLVDGLSAVMWLADGGGGPSDVMLWAGFSDVMCCGEMSGVMWLAEGLSGVMWLAAAALAKCLLEGVREEMGRRAGGLPCEGAGFRAARTLGWVTFIWWSSDVTSGEAGLLEEE